MTYQRMYITLSRWSYPTPNSQIRGPPPHTRGRDIPTSPSYDPKHSHTLFSSSTSYLTFQAFFDDICLHLHFTPSEPKCLPTLYDSPLCCLRIHLIYLVSRSVPQDADQLPRTGHLQGGCHPGAGPGVRFPRSPPFPAYLMRIT